MLEELMVKARCLVPRASLVIVVLAGSACGARSLETSDANTKISAKIAQQQPDLRGLTVACPSDLKAEKGASFVCSVRADGGFTGEVQVDQIDDAGTLAIRYPAPPGTGPRATVLVVPTTAPP